MRIEGNGKVDVLELKHEGANSRFAHRMKPFGYPCDIERVKGENYALIRFDDIHEVDNLIRMLEEFKRLNCAHFGEWVFMP